MLYKSRIICGVIVSSIVSLIGINANLGAAGFHFNERISKAMSSTFIRNKKYRSKESGNAQIENENGG